MKIMKLWLLNNPLLGDISINFTHKGKPLDLVCLSGVNGSGKTTILDIIFSLTNLLHHSRADRSFKYEKPTALNSTEFIQLDLEWENVLISIYYGDKKNIQYCPMARQFFLKIGEPIPSTVRLISEHLPYVIKMVPHTWQEIENYLINYSYISPKGFEDVTQFINYYLVAIGKHLDGIDRISQRIRIKTKNGDEHGMDRLSKGELKMLDILVRTYIESWNNVYVIDDIDQGLHPEWQDEIMKTMKELSRVRQCQIIISSHSANIWNALDETSIIRMPTPERIIKGEKNE